VNTAQKRDDDGAVSAGDERTVKSSHWKIQGYYGPNQGQGAAVGERVCKCDVVLFHYFLHLSEQYLTSFHTFSHFLRQLNGIPQRAHVFVGRFSFLIPLGICNPVVLESTFPHQ
jgi:hypothetical protein